MIKKRQVINIPDPRLTKEQRDAILQKERAKWGQPVSQAKINLVSAILCAGCKAYTVNVENDICDRCREQIKANQAKDWWVMGTLMFFVAAAVIGLGLILRFFWFGSGHGN